MSPLRPQACRISTKERSGTDTRSDYWEGSRYNAGDKYTVNGDHTFRAVWKTAPGGSSKKGVRTGDDNYLAIWIVLLLASAAGTAVIALARKK